MTQKTTKIWISKSELKQLVSEACKCEIHESEDVCGSCGEKELDCECMSESRHARRKSEQKKK